MAQDLALKVLLQAVDQSSGPFHSFGSNLLGLSGPAGTVANILMTVGAAAIGIGAKAVTMAANFQESMTQLVTGAGESQKNIGMVSNGILDLAVSTGTTTQQLSQGMFMIESAGFHGAAGLNVLKIAAEGAQVGNADLGTVATTLTTVLHDYHMSANDTAAAMNGLTATVSNGKTHLQDLANSMGNVLPLAASLGVSFPQVAGAIAQMTNSGMTAQRASMNLGNAIRSLGAPGSAAVKAMDSVGLSAQQLHDALSTQGLSGALKLIEEHVGSTFPAGSVQAVTAFKAIMGGATGYNVALMLGGKNMKDYESNINNISKAMTTGKGSVNGWTAVQGDFNFKIAQAKEVVETLMIRIGTALLPVLTKLMNQVIPIAMQFSNWITKSGILNTIAGDLSATIGTAVKIIGGLIGAVTAVVGWFNKASPAALLVRDALIAIGAAIAIIKIGNFIATIPTLLAQLGAWLAATWAQVAALIAEALAEMAANWPIYLIIAAVLILIGIVILLVKHWGAVVSFLRGAWQSFSSWFMGALHAVGNFFASIWNGIKNFFVGLWTSIVGFFKTHILLIIAIVTGPLGALIILIITHWTQIKHFFTGLWQDVVNIFNTAKNWVMTSITNLWNTVRNFFANLPAEALQWGKNIIQGFINGIKNMLGAVGNAASSVVGTVKSFLGFHSPTEKGPGATADQWPTNFMQMYAKGLTNAIPALQAAVNVAAQPLAKFATAPNTASVPASTPVGASGGQVNNITITINAKNANADEVARKVEQRLSSLLKRSGNLTTVTSGGKAP